MGAIFTGIGALNEGRAAASGDRYRARVARNNASIQEANAQYAEAKGRSREAVVRERTAQTIGEQRAAFAANNVEAGSGSALRLQADAASVGETEVSNVRNTAAREAYSFRVRELGFNTEASMEDWKVGQDKDRALINYWAGATSFFGMGSGRASGPSQERSGADTGGGSSGSGYSSRYDSWLDTGSDSSGSSDSGSSSMVV